MIDLTKKENWTPELIYIHRSRLIIGLVLGFIFGILYSLYFISILILTK